MHRNLSSMSMLMHYHKIQEIASQDFQNTNSPLDVHPKLHQDVKTAQMNAKK